MNTHPAPAAPGYYWAKLLNPTRMPVGEDWVSFDWEVVEVIDNNGEGDEQFAVAVPGIGPWQWPKDFEWGPLIDMSSRPDGSRPFVAVDLAKPAEITVSELGLPAKGTDINRWIDGELERSTVIMSDMVERAHAAEVARGAALQVIADKDTLISNLQAAGYTVFEPGQAPESTFDFFAHLTRQRQWSERTFGPGDRAAGVVDHIRKELNEIEADPGDLKEWIDVVILGLDGAWRSGASPKEIIDALVAKQAKNEARVWPDWRTADPNKAIEHDRTHD